MTDTRDQRAFQVAPAPLAIPVRNSDPFFRAQTGPETSSSEPHVYTGPNRLTAFVGLSMTATESKPSGMVTRSAV